MRGIEVMSINDQLENSKCSSLKRESMRVVLVGDSAQCQQPTYRSADLVTLKNVLEGKCKGYIYHSSMNGDAILLDKIEKQEDQATNIYIASDTGFQLGSADIGTICFDNICSEIEKFTQDMFAQPKLEVEEPVCGAIYLKTQDNLKHSLNSMHIGIVGQRVSNLPKELIGTIELAEILPIEINEPNLQERALPTNVFKCNEPPAKTTKAAKRSLFNGGKDKYKDHAMVKQVEKISRSAKFYLRVYCLKGR